jgi:hypothetical protein
VKDVQLLNGDVSVTVIVPEPTDDVRIVVDGPRSPFVLVNGANGMHLRFAGALAENERLWIESQRRTCYRRLKATRGAERVPSHEHLSVPTAQEGWGWMRLEKGRNVFSLLDSR